MANTNTKLDDLLARDMFNVDDLSSLIEDLRRSDDEQDRADQERAEEFASLLADCDAEDVIADRYFVEYAQDLAYDIGVIPHDVPWPLYYIDWEAAAEALRMDYAGIEFEGRIYWVR